MVRESRHLWVGNLPENVREEDILSHFTRFGRVEKVKLLVKTSPDGGRAAFVDFVDIRSATKANEATHRMGERELRTNYNEPGKPNFGRSAFTPQPYAGPGGVTYVPVPTYSPIDHVIHPGSMYRPIVRDDRRHVSGQVAFSSRHRSRSRSPGSRGRSPGSRGRASSLSSVSDGNRSPSPARNFSSDSDSERAPVARPSSISVKNLSARSSDQSLEEALYHEFKKVGEIVSIAIFGEGSDRSAVVKFTKSEDAERAIQSTGKMFLGQEMKVSLKEDPEDLVSQRDEIAFDPHATRTVFVGNLEKTIMHGELRKVFERFGHVVDVDIKKMQMGLTTYAFVQYIDINGSMKAKRRMDREFIGRNRVKAGYGRGTPTNSLWVGNLPSSVADHQLSKAFHPFGFVQRVLVDKRLCQALIRFETIQAATHAFAEMHGKYFLGKRLAVDYASPPCRDGFYTRMEKHGLLDRRTLAPSPTPPDAHMNYQSILHSTFASRGAFADRYAATRPTPTPFLRSSVIPTSEELSRFADPRVEKYPASSDDRDFDFEKELRDYGYLQRDYEGDLDRGRSPTSIRGRSPTSIGGRSPRRRFSRESISPVNSPSYSEQSSKDRKKKRKYLEEMGGELAHKKEKRRKKEKKEKKKQKALKGTIDLGYNQNEDEDFDVAAHEAALKQQAALAAAAAAELSRAEKKKGKKEKKKEEKAKKKELKKQKKLLKKQELNTKMHESIVSALAPNLPPNFTAAATVTPAATITSAPKSVAQVAAVQAPAAQPPAAQLPATQVVQNAVAPTSVVQTAVLQSPVSQTAALQTPITPTQATATPAAQTPTEDSSENKSNLTADVKQADKKVDVKAEPNSADSIPAKTDSTPSEPLADDGHESLTPVSSDGASVPTSVSSDAAVQSSTLDAATEDGEIQEEPQPAPQTTENISPVIKQEASDEGSSPTDISEEVKQATENKEKADAASNDANKAAQQERPPTPPTPGLEEEAIRSAMYQNVPTGGISLIPDATPVPGSVVPVAPVVIATPVPINAVPAALPTTGPSAISMLPTASQKELDSDDSSDSSVSSSSSDDDSSDEEDKKVLQKQLYRAATKTAAEMAHKQEKLPMSALSDPRSADSRDRKEVREPKAYRSSRRLEDVSDLERRSTEYRSRDRSASSRDREKEYRSKYVDYRHTPLAYGERRRTRSPELFRRSGSPPARSKSPYRHLESRREAIRVKSPSKTPPRSSYERKERSANEHRVVRDERSSTPPPPPPPPDMHNPPQPADPPRNPPTSNGATTIAAISTNSSSPYGATPAAPSNPDSLLDLLRRFPVMWQGLLGLKNDTAAVQMHYLSGNVRFAEVPLPRAAQPQEVPPPLRISQRMKLEPSQLEGVNKRILSPKDHCMLLALPCGRDPLDVHAQTRALKTGFITYLQQKQAAGIINVNNPQTKQPAYVLHIFPPCEFAQGHLTRVAPDLLDSAADSGHLMVLITPV